MLNKLINTGSVKIFLKEFILLNIFISVFILLLVEFPLSFYLVVIVLLLNLIFLNLIIKKRNEELYRIQTVINKIGKNEFKRSDEIKLKNLESLQDEIKKMFEKEKNDIEYLKRLEKVRTEFLANVSHELRTPIFAIQGYIETLLDGAIDDKNVNRHFLNKAISHTINLNNLINDLIDISMIESGEMKMSFRYFDINEYLSQLVSELVPLAQEKNIDLIFYPAKSNLLVFGDRVRLKQVFVNLITNAIKYTEKGKVELFVEDTEKACRITIKDTGIGISDEDIERIFERFYRVDKARSKAVGGTGLGLAIVKHIVEAHNSKIEVKSKLGAGSEFSFQLKK